MNPIAAKIKKLLRMKRGGTQSEIDTALKLAKELAQKHGLDLGSINPDDDEKRASDYRQEVIAARLAPESRYASRIIREYFGVEVVFKSYEGRMAIIGRGWEVEIAVYVFRFCRAAFLRSWDKADGRLRNRAQFIKGMYRGMCHNLDKSHKQSEPGLVVSLNAVVSQFYPALVEKPQRDTGKSDASRLAGFMAGLDTHIRSGMQDGLSRPALPQSA